MNVRLRSSAEVTSQPPRQLLAFRDEPIADDIRQSAHCSHDCMKSVIKIRRKTFVHA